jgi:predicted phage terminase large subunit-like protein
LNRRAARKSLLGFTEYTNPAYIGAEHHKLICEKLEAVERGEIDRLMIFMPPRHGKSELASRRFPAWYLGRNPHKSIIAASYNSDLAGDFGRTVRNIVASPEFGRLFNVGLAQDSRAADRWNTVQGGAYVAAGVGTAITGRGANVLLIDDPLKDRQEADSETTRNSVWNWYTSTAYTRLMPGGSIVLIQTRWHEDDLAGRLLEEMQRGGDQWDVLELKAIDDGKALWPDWYPVEALERIRAAIGPRDWSALYQQNPVPDEGTFFLRDWVRWYDEPPQGLRVYGASDYAVTEGGGDYTVHLVAGVSESDDLYILDRWRAQTTPDIWVDAFIGLLKTWKPIEWAEENGQIIKAVGSLIDRKQIEERAWCFRKQFASTADKPTRAQAIRGRMAAGKVYLPRNAPWVGEFLSELLSFPAGKNDDQVDTLSLLGRMLGEMLAGRVPRADPDPPLIQQPTYGDIMKRHLAARARQRA